MIETRGNIIGHISSKNSIVGKINNSILNFYPEVEEGGVLVFNHATVEEVVLEV